MITKKEEKDIFNLLAKQEKTADFDLISMQSKNTYPWLNSLDDKPDKPEGFDVSYGAFGIK